jgi:hypothetical protein
VLTAIRKEAAADGEIPDDIKVAFGQAPAHGLTGDVIALGEPDQFPCQQLQGPNGHGLRVASNRLSRPAGLPLCPRAYDRLLGAVLR